MKINIGKLLRLAGRVIIAAPAVIEAVKPVLRKRKARRQDGAEVAPTPPTTSEPTQPADASSMPAAPI